MTVEDKNGVETPAAGVETPPNPDNGTNVEPGTPPVALSPEEVTKELSYLKTELKKVIDQRDDLKKKARELEEAKVRERLEGLQSSGKFEEANKELAAKLAALQTQNQELLTKAENFDIFVQQLRQDLYNKLPESKRKFAEKFDLEELKEFVALEEAASQKVGAAEPGRPGKGGVDLTRVTFDDFRNMTSEQKEALAQKAPAKYQEFIKQISSKRRF